MDVLCCACHYHKHHLHYHHHHHYHYYFSRSVCCSAQPHAKVMTHLKVYGELLHVKINGYSSIQYYWIHCSYYLIS